MSLLGNIDQNIWPYIISENYSWQWCQPIAIGTERFVVAADAADFNDDVVVVVCLFVCVLKNINILVYIMTILSVVLATFYLFIAVMHVRRWKINVKFKWSVRQ